MSCEIWILLSEDLAVSEGKQSQKRDFRVDIYPDQKFQVLTGQIRFDKFIAWSTQLFVHHKHISFDDNLFLCNMLKVERIKY